jgi:ubiquinone/menaquinone biosynthesis C-methylase UbiE/ADP-ribose pyrophosphatase YjhB (NUDIX family)
MTLRAVRLDTDVTNPTILSAALFERDERVLTAHRKPGRPPFAGQWLLPMTPVQPIETAEDAVKRYAREQFGVEVASEAFVDTVYMEDPDDRVQYITNIFRAQLRGGPMRFRADGDYDDARWLASAEVEQLWMPPSLRDPLVKIMTDPQYGPDTDWSVAEAQAVPLAERAEPLAARQSPAPDNRAAWDAIAKAYQDDFYGERSLGRLRWTRGMFEDDLHMLGDICGRRALVVGCGGGQDCVALARMGAVAVGIDPSGQQISYAKKLAAKHGADNASFVQGTADDLSRFDDESFDLVVSIHALQFVEHADTAMREAARVLRPAGRIAITVPHPWDQVFSDASPHYAQRSYFSGVTPYIDWNWDEKKFGESGRLRDWRRTVGEWFTLFVEAGFIVERILEPYQGGMSEEDAAGYDMQRAKLMPHVLIFKARKPSDAAPDR